MCIRDRCPPPSPPSPSPAIVNAPKAAKSDQSDAGSAGLDPGTVESTIKTLLSHLITGEFNSPANSVRTPWVRVEP
eukprot:2239787-Pyramimonas_sp.AAC.1